jgi:hypothetical protein
VYPTHTRAIVLTRLPALKGILFETIRPFSSTKHLMDFGIPATTLTFAQHPIRYCFLLIAHEILSMDYGHEE